MKERIEHLQDAMAEQGYVTDRATATAAYLAITLRKPLLIEGPPGVGKTEVAKVLARVLETELIRLQCYEGLDVSTALYEWNYPKQLLHIKLGETSGQSIAQREAEIFSEAFLLERPLLRAIRATRRAVLLIDEVDRSDEEFEAFLLEVLSEHQVTIPEIGTLRAEHDPCVVLTSNRTRELSEALRRRCLYLWIDYPSLEKELAIVRAKVPGVGDRLAAELTGFIQAVRRQRLVKTPGVAETLDWSHALVALQADALDDAVATETLGCFLKDEADVRQMRAEIETRGVTSLVAAGRGGV
ncbi:MAG TPA: MoxR family ATPase [Gemmatimonadaceae bacterium]|nr:MoxR family ATPase [Gemmatimonadaceae bacterium]